MSVIMLIAGLILGFLYGMRFERRRIQRIYRSLYPYRFEGTW